MQRGRQKQKPSDWPFTMEQIGRELRKIYRRPERLPRRLRTLVRGLEIKSERDQRPQQRDETERYTR
jgi:hypothetical protein